MKSLYSKILRCKMVIMTTRTFLRLALVVLAISSAIDQSSKGQEAKTVEHKQVTSVATLSHSATGIQSDVIDPNALLKEIEQLFPMPLEVEGKWGYVDSDGKFTIKPQYDEATRFSKNLAAVNMNGKWGYIDKLGTMMIPLQFDYAETHSEELAAIAKDKKWGYIGRSGELVIPTTFDGAKSFSENLGAVKRDKKWGYINKEGKIIIPLQFDLAESFAEERAIVTIMDRIPMNRYYTKFKPRHGFIDRTGRFVIQPILDDALPFCQGLAAFKGGVKYSVMLNQDGGIDIGGKWGYMDLNGKVVIHQMFEDARSFTKDGLAAVKLDNKWGCINKTGRMIIEPQFESILYLHLPISKVQINGKLVAIEIDAENGTYTIKDK